MGRPPVVNVTGRATQLVEGTIRMTIAILITGATIALLLAVEAVTGNMGSWLAPLEGLAINVILFEWAILWFMAVPAYPPDRYFTARGSERMERLFELLGIRGFGRLVIGRIRFSGQRRDLSWFINRTCHAEAVHVMACLGLALFSVVMALRNRWDTLFWAVVFSVPIHLYPIMLQRYNRSRALKILRRRTGEGSVIASPRRPKGVHSFRSAV